MATRATITAGTGNVGGGRLVQTAEGTHDGAFRAFDWVLLLTAGCIWGASFFFIANALDSFQPMLITWLRVALGFATLSLVPRAHARIERADWPRIVLVGVVWMAFPLSMFPIAEQHVSSSVTGMLNGALPLFAAAIASILLHRLPGRRQRVGLAIGTLGVVLIGLPSVTEGSSTAFGVALIVLALMSYGVAINVVVPLQQRYGALPVLRSVAMVAALLLAPFGLAAIPSSSFSWKAAGCTVALGALGSAVAFVAAATLAGRVGSTRGSTTTYLIPVVSLVLGAWVLHESVHVLSVVGSAIVLLGAFVTSRAGR
jgi:drug/metabolite transporter (DMT)-like permease